MHQPFLGRSMRGVSSPKTPNEAPSAPSDYIFGGQGRRVKPLAVIDLFAPRLVPKPPKMHVVRSPALGGPRAIPYWL